MSDPKKFHKSPSQIIRSVYDCEDDIIKVGLEVDNSGITEPDMNTASALNKILKELKIMNFHLSLMTGDEITKDDI